MSNNCKNEFIEAVKKYIENIYEMLNEKADIESLNKIEKIAGDYLPQEFKNLYLAYNGEKESKLFGLMAGMKWMSTQDIIEELTEIKSLDMVIEDDNLSFIKTGEIKTGWIPFAEDFQGRFLVLDLNPNVRGIYGQVIVVNKEMNKAFVIAQSFDDFLDLILEKFELGNLILKDIGGRKIVTWDKGNIYVCGYDISRKQQEEISLNLDRVWNDILSKHAFEGKISLAKLANIDELKITKGFFGCFDDISVDILRYMTNLKVLKINAKEIRNLNVISGLSKLNTLYLENCRLVDDELECIKHIRALIDLSLENISLNDVIGLTDLKRLQYLTLCNVSIKREETLRLLQQIKTLKGVRFENMQIEDMSIIRDFASIMKVQLNLIR